MIKNKPTLIKFGDYIIILGLIVVVTTVGIVYANSEVRNKLWVKSYTVRAQISNQTVSCNNDKLKWLANILVAQTSNNNSPSNQIAYINRDGQLYHCENGYKTKYPLISERINKETRFRYASVTKLWTADAILRLVRQQKIKLNDALSSYLYEINNPVDDRIKEITIKQLLLHRGGFDRYSIFGNDTLGVGEKICPNNLERLNNIRLGFNPDTKMSYSNLGYCLLGEVISRVEKKPYKQVIYDDYNLANTTLKFISNTKMPDEVFYNYVETGIMGVADIYTAYDYDALASSAGLSGNAIELAKQVRQMAEKPEPNIKSVDATLSCNISKLRDCYGYAMFPYQRDQGSKKVYFRDGKLLGLSSLVVVTEDNEVVVLLSNGNPTNGADGSNAVKMQIYEALMSD